MATMALPVSEVTFTVPGTRGVCFRAALLFASVSTILFLAIFLVAGVGDCFGNFDAIFCPCLTASAISSYILTMAAISALIRNRARRIANLALFRAILIFILLTLSWEITTAIVTGSCCLLTVLQCAVATNFLWEMQHKDVIKKAVAFALVGTFLAILPLPPALAFFAGVPVFHYSYTVLFACFILLQLLAYLTFFIFQLPTILFTAQILGLPQQQYCSVFQLLSLFLSA